MTNLRFASNKQLNYMKYRYEYCKGDCESCPCKVEGRRCRYVYEEVKKELDERNKRPEKRD